MREIIFRGKRTDNGEWVEGSLTQFEPKSVILFKSKETDTAFIFDEPFPSHLVEVVISETVGQYTGLTDKNGKKIFEGDILAYLDTDQNEHIEGVMKYGKFNCSCCDGVYGWYIDDGDIRWLEKGTRLNFYVKSNIHDNPELLKEG